MELSQLKEIIKSSLDEFFKNDRDLVDIDINERSMSHKIAEYIQKRIPKLPGKDIPIWNVDCEYNGYGENHPKYLKSRVETVSTDDTEGRTVYPDIIIHKRRDMRKNLLVIEVKKSEREFSKDIEKIKDFITTEDFHYTFGLMLIINVPYNAENRYCCYWYPETNNA